MHLFWIVGENSGDTHAAKLIAELSALRPSWKHSGMTGPKMIAAGCRQVAHIQEASLMGISEVISQLPRILRLRETLISEITAIHPDLVILVDFPDFNISLMKKLRKRSGQKIRILYYISPQIWAWRKGRAKSLAKHVDAMAVLFPFEVEFYRKYGLETVCFGHPLVGEVHPSKTTETIREELGIRDRKIIALLPGSREQEVLRILPTQLQAIDLFRQNHPEVQAVIVKAPGLSSAIFREMTDAFPWAILTEESSYNVLSVSHAALVKSGTSTVETAIAGIPFIVLYKVSRFTYFLARLLIRGVSNIAMVNVLAGKEIVPEFIQKHATPHSLSHALEKIWEGKSRSQMLMDLANLRKQLGEEGATKRLAEWVVNRFGDSHEG